MSVAEYKDFELEISSDISNPLQYSCRVLKSPVGEAEQCAISFWFSKPGVLAQLRTDLVSAVLEIDDPSRGGLSSRAERVLRDFGREVFRSIFVNAAPIHEIYVRSKGASNDLRIKLRISSPELAGLPWEYLYEDNEIIGYVGLRLPLVRYLETPGAAGRMNVKGPLRILGMVSEPHGDEWPKLNSAKERDRINKGIDALQRQGLVDFQWVPGGTGKDLMNKLLEGEWHIFHFIGHGGVESTAATAIGNGRSFDERGFIVMVDEDGKAVRKFAPDLATMLIGARRSLRLVVLNCCESARVNVGDKFGNPAIGLMRSGWGLPAVIAMQFPITDGAAIRMSEGFYAALAKNRPVDEAITIARRLIQERPSVEWGIPVLYMRSVDGKIFEVDNSEISAPASVASTSKEDLQKRRTEFMAAVADGAKAEELELLINEGRQLLLELKDDQELAKHLAKIYLYLGGVQQRERKLSKAAASFASALQLNPKSADYRVRRANFNVLLGFYENALSDITEAIKLDPHNAEYYWIKGVICSVASGPENKGGFLQEAVESFGIAASMKPGEPKYFVSRANVYVQLGEVDNALRDMDDAIALAPTNADFAAQRAKISRQAA